MAYIATCTDKGRVKATNEDSCCVEVAQTPLGEVVMAVVCDGVGGLDRGELASATVVERFVAWFERDLGPLADSMARSGSFDFGAVRAVWGALLAELNGSIRSYGTRAGARLGTTFTGVIATGGRYLLGHVGDCRAYRLGHDDFAQVSHDQTLLAKKLESGELTPEQAATFDKRHVILQSVGTQRQLKPEFSEGTLGPDELFVICCDGVWRKAGNEGVRQHFQGVDFRDEAALAAACRQLLLDDLAQGERDNLTVVCLSGDLAGAAAAIEQADAPTEVFEDEGDEPDAPTEDFGQPEDEDDPDAPTEVFDQPDEDDPDAPTEVFGQPDDPDDPDAPTEVFEDADDDPDAPTEAFEQPDDDDPDAPTEIFEDGDADDPDAPTEVFEDADDDPDAPTEAFEQPDDDDPDAPTEVFPKDGEA